MRYLDEVMALLQEVRWTQAEAVERAAATLADTIANDHLIFVFGPSHASILAQELFYRAGGLVPVNAILPPGLTTNVHPITLTTRLERLPGFGTQIVAETPIGAGDVLIVISVSGRNITAVEVAQKAKARGATILAVTAVKYSQAVAPRQPGTPRLYEVADLVLDLSSPVGDALVEVAGLRQRVGPSSTVVGAALLNSVVVRTAELLLEREHEPPVFMSANVDGSEEHNRRWLERYAGRLTYL
ncbi:MAG: SIS domain-containing protein [Anaerolineae bacterium]|nr:SIS domain-containing protein [Anaerolineae bacterium]